jgi:adenylate cyclase class 2
VLEVESKYRSPGNDKVEKALAKLGAKKTWGGTMEDVYYAHPSRDFGKTDEALRLRKTDDASELTYKGPRMQSLTVKAREEITLKTDNPLAVARIVERLGFRESFVVRKSRSSYILDKLRVEVDDVEGLGEFVELEILTESPERSKMLMETARTELGLEKLEPRTYLEMLIEKMASERSHKE